MPYLIINWKKNQYVQSDDAEICIRRMLWLVQPRGRWEGDEVDFKRSPSHLYPFGCKLIDDIIDRANLTFKMSYYSQHLEGINSPESLAFIFTHGRIPGKRLITNITHVQKNLQTT